ncbi:MAG: acyloxyacyl hydrolase [Syntrophorhabdaceae bacterium]
MTKQIRRCAPFHFLSMLFIVLFFPCLVLADQQGISVGYGLATLNPPSDLGHLHDGDYYDFVQITYSYEKALSGKFNLALEPFVGIVNRPTSGLDVGVAIGGRYYFGQSNYQGFFGTVSVGGAYTTVKFEEQGAHGVFILQGGVGYKWEKLFVESKFRHYSNGGLTYPNKSINATIVGMGFTF